MMPVDVLLVVLINSMLMMLLVILPETNYYMRLIYVFVAVYHDIIVLSFHLIHAE